MYGNLLNILIITSLLLLCVAMVLLVRFVWVFPRRRQLPPRWQMAVVALAMLATGFIMGVIPGIRELSNLSFTEELLGRAMLLPEPADQYSSYGEDITGDGVSYRLYRLEAGQSEQVAAALAQPGQRPEGTREGWKKLAWTRLQKPADREKVKELLEFAQTWLHKKFDLEARIRADLSKGQSVHFAGYYKPLADGELYFWFPARGELLLVDIAT